MLDIFDWNSAYETWFVDQIGYYSITGEAWNFRCMISTWRF